MQKAGIDYAKWEENIVTFPELNDFYQLQYNANKALKLWTVI